jgi:hypothetical protein
VGMCSRGTENAEAQGVQLTHSAAVGGCRVLLLLLTLTLTLPPGNQSAQKRCALIPRTLIASGLLPGESKSKSKKLCRIKETTRDRAELTVTRRRRFPWSSSNTAAIHRRSCRTG